ncbi:RNA polymerase sigma factor [Sorangium sp. So ce233]|uniref:RNA polymerase sigma factor n=1 Tax=Sorangium sp. So ce233 TaxID=3133290 RepID=UPI003F641767
MNRGEALTLVELPAAVPPESRAAAGRLAALVTEHSAFVWRSLVRLGVPRADAEDAVQQVFLVAARRLGDIECGRESAFLFSTSLRIASRARRTQQRRREVLEDVPCDRVDPAPGPEELVDRARARATVEAILDTMPLDLRAVFVLFELEQMTMTAIAAMLELPAGTVASRLRRAREHFQVAVRRLEARAHFRGEFHE